MAITNSITTKWAAAAKVELQENSIGMMITDGQWSVESEGAKTISIIGVTTPTISDYVPGTTELSYEAITDNKIDIDLDVYKSFSFKYDEVEVAQSTPDYVPAAMTQAGGALALEADSKVLGLYGATAIPAANKIGAIAASIDIKEANILRYIGSVAGKLRAQHVARGTGFMVVPVWFMDKFVQAAGSKLTDNAQVFDSGVVYKYAGLNIIESTEVYEMGTGDDEAQIMAFSPRAIGMGVTVSKVETLKNPNAFGELVRGLFAFGADVVYGTEVVVLSATEGTES